MGLSREQQVDYVEAADASLIACSEVPQPLLTILQEADLQPPQGMAALARWLREAEEIPEGVKEKVEKTRSILATAVAVRLAYAHVEQAEPSFLSTGLAALPPRTPQ